MIKLFPLCPILEEWDKSTQHLERDDVEDDPFLAGRALTPALPLPLAVFFEYEHEQEGYRLFEPPADLLSGEALDHWRGRGRLVADKLKQVLKTDLCGLINRYYELTQQLALVGDCFSARGELAAPRRTFSVTLLVSQRWLERDERGELGLVLVLREADDDWNPIPLSPPAAPGADAGA